MWQTLQNSGCLAERGTATLGCFPVIVGNIIFWLLILAGIVAVFMIILSGFKFVTSGGDSKKAEGAKKTLTFAILGLLLIFSAFFIPLLIARTTGINTTCITKFGFSQCVPEDIAFSCSNAHPSGFCDSGKKCVPNDTGSHMVCKYLCSDTHTNGYCRVGRCTRVGAPDNFECK